MTMIKFQNNWQLILWFDDLPEEMFLLCFFINTVIHHAYILHIDNAVLQKYDLHNLADCGSPAGTGHAGPQGQ